MKSSKTNSLIKIKWISASKPRPQHQMMEFLHQSFKSWLKAMTTFTETLTTFGWSTRFHTLKCLVTVGEARPREEYFPLSPESSLLFLIRLETFLDRDLRSLSGSICDGQTAGRLGRDAHLLAKLQWRRNMNENIEFRLFNETYRYMYCSTCPPKKGNALSFLTKRLNVPTTKQVSDQIIICN